MLLSILFLAALAVLILAAAPPAEPQYAGESVSDWLARYEWACIHDPAPRPRAQRRVAAAAIAQMGTNAVPFLVRWISYEPPPMPKPLNSLLRTRALRPVANLFEQRQKRAWFAPHALGDLGPTAASAIPDLGRTILANNPACALPGQTVQLPTNAVAARAWGAILMILVRSQGHPAVRDSISTSTNPVVAYIADQCNPSRAWTLTPFRPTPGPRAADDDGPPL